MLRRSMFGLEIERNRRNLTRSILLVILFLAIAGLVTYVNLSIAPTLPPEILKPPTPTPNILITPLSSPTPEGGQQATPTIVLAPTVTLAPSGPIDTPSSEEDAEVELPVADEAQPTETPTIVPSRQATACSPGVNITSPPSGAVVSTVVTFFGTATADAFGYYTMEVSGPRTNGVWTTLPTENSGQRVLDSILASVDVSSWPAGAHSFRLSVYDSSEALIDQCDVALSVDTGNS
jgi:hypothetical protein